jgi:hypothetical protein
MRALLLAGMPTAIGLAIGAVAMPAWSRAAQLPSATTASCVALSKAADQPIDASALLRGCLADAAAGARIGLAPGIYHIRGPITIAKPVTLTSTGYRARACGADRDASCATIEIGLPDQASLAARPALLVTAPDVHLVRIAIRGAKDADPARDQQICNGSGPRQAGGGLRVSASGFVLQDAAIANFSCYSALEVTSGVNSIAIVNNLIIGNGNHSQHNMWSDGITILDAVHALIANNTFIDNTDVQLILGGCRMCTIRGNRFRHRPASAGGSFAELMLHSWPNTSGRYDGSITTGNNIDCGPEQRCGYGMQLGANPWYSGHTSGGKVVGNSIRDAMVGLNIDGLTGAMIVGGNRVASSGGRFPSTCGVRDWPASNIAPASLAFVTGTKELSSNTGGIDTSHCLLNL